MKNEQGFLETFKKLFPSCMISEDLVHEIFKQFPENDLDKLHRLSHFLGQCAHETLSFTRFTENLNYSVKGLLTVFPKYFKDKNVNLYARNPEKIANLVYANRMGNGDENSKDGWKFRGRGLIQLTGRSNYEEFSNYCKEDFLENPDKILEPKNMLKSAIWFWNKNNLNRYADCNEIVRITRKINGGTNGLDDRSIKTNQCFNTFKLFF